MHIAQGSLVVNGIEVSAGDGAMITDESQLTLDIENSVDALLFELP
ncbi:hypothetical protein [Oceanospirillum beijerinckii]